MMRKRLLLILGCVASVLLAGYVTLRLTAPRHRITEENFAAINKGMTEEDVVELLGVKPGIYASNFEEVFWPDGLNNREGVRHEDWVGEEIAVWIHFDKDGHVLDKFKGYVIPGNASFLDKLRRWLGM